MNKPYVKQYNEEGELTNRIVDVYLTRFPNRSTRRSKPARFTNNRTGFHLHVTNGVKFKRYTQEVVDKKTGKTKILQHYTY